MRAAAIFLALGLAACGGGAKPAAQDPSKDDQEEIQYEDLPADDSSMPVENEHCCCDYIADLDQGADSAQEVHAYEDKSVGECDAAGGVCSDDYAACQVE